FVVQINRVHQLAVDVELELLVGCVADAHRTRAAITLQVVEGLLGEVVPAVDTIHELQGAGTISRGLLPAILQPVPKPRGFLAEADADKTVDRESGIANPCVTIIPIALATDFLGQATSGGGDNG